MAGKQLKVYIIGSLKNREIPDIKIRLSKLDFDAFAFWFSAGCAFCEHSADESWRAFHEKLGHTYRQALKCPDAENIFNFDKRHLDDCDIAILFLPAGRAGHLESGYVRGFRDGVMKACEQLGGYLNKQMEKVDGLLADPVNAAALQVFYKLSKELKKVRNKNKNNKKLYILLDDSDRWDIMYKFADDVFHSFEELAEQLEKDKKEMRKSR